jgi:hypothetical protein
MRCLFGFVIVICAAASNASATTMVATDNQTGPTYPSNPSTGSWTPSYDPINTSNDVLLNASPSAQSGDFTLEGSTGVSILTDGAFGAINGLGMDATHTNWATVGNDVQGGGTSLTYTFTPTQLTSLVTYGGWNDNGRDQQDYSVSYSIDGGMTFLPLGSVDFNPSVAMNTPSADRVTFTDDSGLLAGGSLIDALQFNFDQPDVENNYVGLAEIAAYSPVAVPEPASIILVGLGAACFLAARRRRRA